MKAQSNFDVSSPLRCKVKLAQRLVWTSDRQGFVFAMSTLTLAHNFWGSANAPLMKEHDL
jgi:hypothetical protein